MDFNREMNFSSTPVKRIRFRGDSFKAETEPLLENDNSDDFNSARNGEILKERGLFTFSLSTLRHAIVSFLCVISSRSSEVRAAGLSSCRTKPWLLPGP